MEHFSSLTSEKSHLSAVVIQKMKNNGLFRSLGEEATSNRISIRLNPKGSKIDEKVCAALIPGNQIPNDQLNAF